MNPQFKRIGSFRFDPLYLRTIGGEKGSNCSQPRKMGPKVLTFEVGLVNSNCPREEHQGRDPCFVVPQMSEYSSHRLNED